LYQNRFGSWRLFGSLPGLLTPPIFPELVRCTIKENKMKDIFIKWFMSINAAIIRLSRGLIGSKLGTQTILILHTTGRTSGQERSIPIAYFEYEGSYLIVGSNWGKEKNADWYLNLKKDPRASLEIKGQLIPALAREALGAEYDLLWKFATKRHPAYLDYREMTSRHIPLMLFERVN
jgi:deazaflavin-dependent oxidoreductase (nitroreductase family)